MTDLTFRPAPKPERRPKKAQKPLKRSGRIARKTPIAKAQKPLAKVGKQKPKREAKNREYYASPEWRAKRKAVFERDGYRCVERVEILVGGNTPFTIWCPNRGEVVNGKQTARGLVAEEKGYQHRGHEGQIDRIVTRCKDCDRRRTPLERANHANGFRQSHVGHSEER